MGFMRRKSVVATDAEEVRPRNRLSKPMTSKSPSSQRSPSGKQSPKTGSKTVSVSSQINLSRSVSKKEPMVQVLPQPAEVDTEVKPQLPAKDVQKKIGVASLVKQFENAASTSQQSFGSPVVPQQPLSSGYGSDRLTGAQQQQHMQNVLSGERFKFHKHSISSLPSPTASLEKLVDPYAIPRRRESSYRPGEATRKPSVEDKENQSPAEDRKPLPNIDKPLPPIRLEAQNELVARETWSSPLGPSAARAVTPANLEHRAIGSLRLGSLRIVNGRSSPVLSELSRQLISRQLRDVSSEYADSVYSKDLDSEAWEDDHVAEEVDDAVAEIEEPSTPTRTTFEAEPQQPYTPEDDPTGRQRRTQSQFGTPVHTPDRTSMMAQSYMSELQNSPFSPGTVSPVSTSSIVHHQNGDHSPFSAGTVSPMSTSSVGHYEKEGFDCSPVVDYSGHTMDRRRISLESEHLSIESEQPSIQSKPSAVDTVSTRNQVFSSALEYHTPHFQPPPSPERGISPESVRPDSFGKPYAKTDSGYDSGNSIISLDVNDTQGESSHVPLAIEIAPMSEPSVAADEPVSMTISPKKEGSPRKLGRFFPIRPTAHNSVATEPVVPTLKTFRYESSAPVNTTVLTAKSEDSPTKMKKDKEAAAAAKAAKKLHKSRPLSRVRESNEIVVQRLASCGSTLDIPNIPDATKARLQLRSQQVPELQKTFTSQNHIKNQPSTSSLALPITDIRFPSPMPSLDEEDRTSRGSKKDRGRSKSRTRSKSRRRSFLDIFKSEKDVERREAQPSREETRISIADFGDVVRSLGANPYDIAHSRPHTPDHATNRTEGQRMNPHNISINAPRKRLSMNDEEASEFARRRSHSFSHNEKGERRSFMDDYGIFSGRIVRASMTEDDVPPIPPIPDKEELKRISQRYSLQSSQRQSLQSPHLSTPTEVRKFWDESPSSERYTESSPAPLPPAHSPRPSFVDHTYDGYHPVEQELELAPPPPSHSPAPIDIAGPRPSSRSPRPRGSGNEHESRSPWDAQARVWRARRKSAGEALQHHRNSLDIGSGYYQHGNDAVIEDDDGPIYPVIPRRGPGRENWSHQQSGRWMSGEAQNDDFVPEPHPPRSHTWDNSTHNPYRFDHERQYHSHSSYQARQQRYPDWDENEGYVQDNGPPHFSNQNGYGVRYSHIGTGSQQPFYSHLNRPIDRPFDDPPSAQDDSDDEHGYHGQYYTPQTSPARGRGRKPQQYDYSQPNGYERQYHQQSYDQYQPHTYQVEHQYEDNYSQPTPRQPKEQQQQQPPPNHQQYYQPNPTQYYHSALAPPSLATSRPSSRHSQHSIRSNVSTTSLADELHPDILHRPSPAPDYGRYSGGMSFGYEGRDKGFGGSAGTRSVSGKADAMFKGKELRGSHGVDLGDVPVIGIVKKIQPSPRSERSTRSARSLRTAPLTTYAPSPVLGQTSSSSSSSC